MKPMRDALAVIVARAGSKRFPGKNRAVVGNYPAIYRAIKALNESKRRLAGIVVSTDDPELARLALRYGCYLVNRPPDLASDTATIDDAVRHAYRTWCADHVEHPLEPGAEAPRFVLIVQANVPLWKPGTVPEILRRLDTGRFTACLTAHQVREQPDWMHVMGADQIVRYAHDPERFRPFRQQDLKPTLRFDGQVVAVRSECLFERCEHAYDYCGPRKTALVREWLYGIDLDEPYDLALANAAADWLRKHPVKGTWA